MPCSVQNRRDYNLALRFQHFVDHAIRKPLRVSPADVLGRVPTAVQQGILPQRAPNLDDPPHKLAAKPCVPRLIPSGGFGHVLFDLRAEFNYPAHLVNRERRRFSITSSDTADCGSRRCSAMRFSTTASSSASSPWSSNSTARRTSICRCGRVNDGNSASTSLKLMPGT